MKRLLFSLLIVVIIAGFILSSCTAPTPAPIPTPSPSPTPTPTPAPAKTERYVFYSMQPGTSVYTMGVGLSSIVNQYTDMKTIVQPMNSPFGAFDTITKGEHHFNTQASFSVYAMSLGIPGPMFPTIEKNKGYPKIRLISHGYSQFFAWMTRKDTGITSLAGLKGKTVSAEYKNVMPATIIAREQLAAVGIDWQKDVKNVPFPSSTAGLGAVTEKKLDACLDVPTAASAQELDFKHGLVVLPFPPELRDKISGSREVLYMKNLPAYTPGLGDKKINALYAIAMFITGEDVPEDAVYKVTKAVIEHAKELAPTNVDFNEFTKENAIPEYPVVPFHPGAIKYYKEIGIWTPAAEAKHNEALARIKTVEQKPIK